MTDSVDTGLNTICGFDRYLMWLKMMMMMMNSSFAPLWGLQRQCFSLVIILYLDYSKAFPAHLLLGLSLPFWLKIVMQLFAVF